MGRFLFIDLETPNQDNDRIVAMSVLIRDNDKVVLDKTWLIDPESEFDIINTRIHGIQPSQVVGAPRFPEVWSELEPLFDGSIIVAHNAAFDLNVLNSTYYHYFRHALPECRYICTLCKERSTTNNQKNTLDACCQRYGIQLINHHSAEDDRNACIQLFDHQFPNYPNVDHRDCSLFVATVPKRTARHKDVEILFADLLGILFGVVGDGIIVPKEQEYLRQWRKKNSSFEKYDNLKNLFDFIDTIASDGMFSLERCYRLIDYLQGILFSDEYEFYEPIGFKRKLFFSMIKGCLSDQEINEAEIETFNRIVETFDYSPEDFTEDIRDQVRDILDLVRSEPMTPEKIHELFSCFTRLVYPVSFSSEQVQIHFQDKRFCLSGTFLRATKDCIEQMITERGGIVCKSVTQKLDYLIVGSQRSQGWKHGDYGTKITKAMALKQKGGNVQIVDEDTFFNQIDGQTP